MRENLKYFDFIKDKTVCFYNEDKPFKKGTVLRDLGDEFEKRGIEVVWGDFQKKPDIYIFDTYLSGTRYDGVKIVKAENLIGRESLHHTYKGIDGIVYNSHWLRKVYLNTFYYEVPNWRVIPLSQPFKGWKGEIPENGEYDIVCISKWWKRPFKRFPLIAESFTLLKNELGYKNAMLHVFGWMTDKPMPYTTGMFPIVKLSNNVRSNSNIKYYQKSFHNGLYESQLSKSHLLVHLSPLDSGPQVITEALSYNVPVLISNNMGAAEWIKEIGATAGIVLDIDPVTDSYKKIKRLPLKKRKFCSNINPAFKVASAMKTILDNYEKYTYEVPRKFRIEGALEMWFEIIFKAWENKNKFS